MTGIFLPPKKGKGNLIQPFRIVPEHCSRLFHNPVCLIEILIEQGELQSLFKGDAVLCASGKQRVYLL